MTEEKERLEKGNVIKLTVGRAVYREEFPDTRMRITYGSERIPGLTILKNMMTCTTGLIL